METYKVYGLKAINIDEIRYIGITRKSLSIRLRGHRKEKRRNPYKMKWVAKHKEEIEIVLIEDKISSLSEANSREQYYIDYYKKQGNKLLNLTIGGDGTPGFPSWNTGKNCTYKDKLIANSPRAKKVFSYDLFGNFIKEYRSVKFASAETGIARASISNISNFKEKHKQSSGFMFRWFRFEKIDSVFYDEEKRAMNISIGKTGKKYKRKCEKSNG